MKIHTNVQNFSIFAKQIQTKVLTTPIVILLLISGLLVGFINTLAAAGSAISLAVFMFLGLPPALANGTNRIPIFFQTLTSSAVYVKNKMVDIRKALILGGILGVGSVLGSLFSMDISEVFFSRVIGLVLLIMLILMIFKPRLWENANEKLLNRKIDILTVFIFLIIGFYGGFIYVGLGYLLLASLVSFMGFDLIRANAMKNVLVFVFIPFSLIVFAYNDNVNYLYGLVHAVGNVLGASFASFLSLKKGVKFVRWMVIIILSIFVLYYLGVFDFHSLLKYFF